MQSAHSGVDAPDLCPGGWSLIILALTMLKPKTDWNYSTVGNWIAG